MVIYTVKNGDTLYTIARRYGVEAQILARDNDLKDPHALSVGETLVILQPKSVYTVGEGENLYGVAQRFGVSVGELWRNNPFLGGKTELDVGEILTIVPEKPTQTREIETNAYVYPSVDRDVLQKTLPYLSYLTVFTYGLDEEGGLIDVQDEEIVEMARQYGTAPILLLSNLDEKGLFSPTAAKRILKDEQARATLIEELGMILARKRYAGIELDFEYLDREDASAYADFVRELRQRFSEEGYSVSVCLAPKTSADQQGILYEGHDYTALGEAADRMLLMTYEWGYSRGEPMAISPMDRVDDVVDYAVSATEASKLWLGIPNYGYDWRLPFVRGESLARSVGNEEAVSLAKEKRAAIEYDEVAEAAFFRYFEKEENGVAEHEVWFEMLRLLESHELGGVGIWNAMRYSPQLWQVLRHTAPIRKKWG